MPAASIFLLLQLTGTGERAITGVTSGLIGMGLDVTWEARQFGFSVHHTSRMRALDPPRYFQDSMQQGTFKSYGHDHYCEVHNNGALMRDVVVLEAPFGLLGLLVERTPGSGFRFPDVQEKDKGMFPFYR